MCNTHIHTHRHNGAERESVSFALIAVFYFNALLQLIELDGGCEKVSHINCVPRLIKLSAGDATLMNQRWASEWV